MCGILFCTQSNFGNHVTDKKPRAFVYVDAWNLFYGALSRGPNKWLDLNALCTSMLNDYRVERIKYYTALLDDREGDGLRPARQKLYLRALRTLGNCEIQYGQFRTHVARLPLAHPEPDGYPMADVLKTEEKRTDVNLASHMVHDAHSGRFDVAVLVSNDSDLAEPLKIIKSEIGLKVGVLNPHEHPVKDIERNATFIKPITRRHLERSQFPARMRDEQGAFERPEAW